MSPFEQTTWSQWCEALKVAHESVPRGIGELGMFTRAEMRSLASNKRDRAAQARRWVKMLNSTIDQSRLLQHAVELEGEADELERQAAESSRARPGLLKWTIG